MKKLLFVSSIFLASVSWADSTTNRMHLTLPTIGSPTWGQKVNGNFQILDATAAALAFSNPWSSTNTYSGYTQFLSTVNWRNLNSGTGQCIGLDSSSNTVIVPCGTGGGGGITTLSTLTPGATTFIFNQDTLQSGATFYVSSGTVAGEFNIHSSPSNVFGNTSSNLTFLMNNSLFSSFDQLTFTGYGRTTPDEVNIRTVGSDGTQFSGWVMGFPSHGTVLETFDQDTTYMLQGSGNGGGETVILSTATGILNLPDNSTLGVYGASSANKPIFGVYSADGSGGSTQRFLVDHSSIVISLPIVSNGSAGTSGQILQSNGTGAAPSWTSAGGGGGGVSVYPATATASFPYGFSASTGVFTTTVTASTITASSDFFGSSWRKNSSANDRLFWNPTLGTHGLELDTFGNANQTWQWSSSGAALDSIYGRMTSQTNSVNQDDLETGISVTNNTTAPNTLPYAAYSAEHFQGSPGSSLSSKLFFGIKYKLGEDAFFFVSPDSVTTFGSAPVSPTFFINESSGSAKFGFVGILTSTPTQALDVTGNVQFSKALMPNGAAGTSGQILQSAGAGSPPTWVNNTGGGGTGGTTICAKLNGSALDNAVSTVNVTSPLTATSSPSGQINLTVDYSSVTTLGYAPTTTKIPEGSNLYFTTARATTTISATVPVLYSNGNISLTQISLSTGVMGSLPASSIAAGSLGTSVIASSITLASMYGAPTLTGTNFTSLPGAQVTSGVPAANIAVGSLGTSVIASSVAASGVTAGSYTNTNLTVGLDGRITAASNGTAGGGGGSSVSSFTYTFNPDQARSTSTTAACAIQNSTSSFTSQLLCDDTANEDGAWSTILSPYAGGTLSADIVFTMTSATSGNVVDQVQIYCSTDTINIDAVTWPASNSSTIAVPGTAKTQKTSTITLSTTGGSCVAGSLAMVRFTRMGGSASDTAAGDQEIRKVRIHE